MGAQKQYVESGGFSQYLYHQVGDIIRDGEVEGKVIKHITDLNKGLPMYSNTSKIYFRLNENGEIDQCRVYVDRVAYLDFDWGHSHRNKRDRRVFQRGIVHVQAYKIKDGVPWRDSFNARSMNNEEMRKFGRILKKACPTVKFR